MITGTEIEQFLKNFNENTITLSVVTLSILALTMYEITAYPIWNYLQKPKLEFKPEIYTEDLKEKKSGLKKIHFIIWVKNHGKTVAESCNIRLKILDVTGKINVVKTLTIRSIEDDFQIPWIVSNDDKDYVVNIFPNKKFSSFFKIPYTVEFMT